MDSTAANPSAGVSSVHPHNHEYGPPGEGTVLLNSQWKVVLNIFFPSMQDLTDTFSPSDSLCGIYQADLQVSGTWRANQSSQRDLPKNLLTDF